MVRPACAQHSPPAACRRPADGSCKRCANASHILVPHAALYVDATYPDSEVGPRCRQQRACLEVAHKQEHACLGDAQPWGSALPPGHSLGVFRCRLQAPPPCCLPVLQCMSVKEVHSNALELVRSPAHLPAGCREVDAGRGSLAAAGRRGCLLSWVAACGRRSASLCGAARRASSKQAPWREQAGLVAGCGDGEHSRLAARLNTPAAFCCCRFPLLLL